MTLMRDMNCCKQNIMFNVFLIGKKYFCQILSKCVYVQKRRVFAFVFVWISTISRIRFSLSFSKGSPICKIFCMFISVLVCTVCLFLMCLKKMYQYDIDSAYNLLFILYFAYNLLFITLLTYCITHTFLFHSVVSISVLVSVPWILISLIIEKVKPVY